MHRNSLLSIVLALLLYLNNIPKEINLEVEKGYTLAIDIPVSVVILAVVGDAIAGAVTTFLSMYWMSSDWHELHSVQYQEQLLVPRLLA